MFPALAMTAVAQTTSPANAKAEKALRARAEEFYKLELNKQFRQAEAMVAEESKDYFYNSGKPNFRDVKVGNIEFTDNGKKAIVHITASVELLAPGVGAQVFTAPATANWKLEKGQWFWYFDKDTALMTPFGKMTFADPKPGGGSMMDIMGKGSVASLEALVTMDHPSVTLTADHPEDSVALTNKLPGKITVSLTENSIDGIHAELDKTTVGPGEKAVLHISRTGKAKSGKLVMNVAPLNLDFEVQVISE
ncbi:MAG TPA: hypothetical protein VHC90_21090 [Bryobacteraceae bacterium]|nr:hypothetical protein [Bryobacteraceae bacterium]